MVCRSASAECSVKALCLHLITWGLQGLPNVPNGPNGIQNEQTGFFA